jgi:hypothetical protein
MRTIERRGILGMIAASLGLSAVRRTAERGRLVEVQVRHGVGPLGVLCFEPRTGAPLPERITAGHGDAVRALAIGGECSVEALLLDEKDEPYLIWPSDGSRVDPESERAGPGMVRRLKLVRIPPFRLVVPLEPDPVVATEWLRLRRVA